MWDERQLANGQYGEQHFVRAGAQIDWYTTEHERVETDSTDAHVGLRSLGALEGLGYSVHMYSTDVGLRYSVYETKTNQLVETLLTLKQVSEKYPQLNIQQSDFTAEQSGTLMLAEPARDPME